MSRMSRVEYRFDAGDQVVTDDGRQGRVVTRAPRSAAGVYTPIYLVELPAGRRTKVRWIDEAELVAVSA